MFFSSAASVLSALFIALVVALQMLSWGQLMKLPANARRLLSRVMAFVGAGIIVSLGMILYAETDLPRIPQLLWAAVAFVSASVVLLVSTIPYVKAAMDREIETRAVEAELQQRFDVLASLEVRASEMLSRIDALRGDLQRTLESVHDSRPNSDSSPTRDPDETTGPTSQVADTAQ